VARMNAIISSDQTDEIMGKFFTEIYDMMSAEALLYKKTKTWNKSQEKTR
jgi:hypothetical protein